MGAPATWALAAPTGTKGHLLSRLPDPGQKGTPFCPGLALGNRDNTGLPTGTNQRFCSSDMIHQMKIKLNLILVLLKLIVHRENT